MTSLGSISAFDAVMTVLLAASVLLAAYLALAVRRLRALAPAEPVPSAAMAAAAADLMRAVQAEIEQRGSVEADEP